MFFHVFHKQFRLTIRWKCCRRLCIIHHEVEHVQYLVYWCLFKLAICLSIFNFNVLFFMFFYPVTSEWDIKSKFDRLYLQKKIKNSCSVRHICYNKLPSFVNYGLWLIGMCFSLYWCWWGWENPMTILVASFNKMFNIITPWFLALCYA